MRPSIKTPSIRDPVLRAAAETVDRFVGKRGDREVLVGDLDAAQQLLEEHKKAIAAGKKSPFKQVHPLAIDQLEQQLPELRKLFAGDPPKPKQKTFCNSFWTEAIAHEGPKRCAEAIATALGGDPKELTLAHFLDALDVFRNKQTDDGEEETARVKALLDPLIADGVINAKDMQALDVFFITGGGGLLSHGPCWVTEDFRFDDVYRLPIEDAKTDKDLRELIDGKYERMFATCGYDRVYVKGKNGELYVALNEKGSVSWIQEGYRMQMRNDESKKPTGEILRVKDVANSVKEATWDLWKKTVEKFVDAWGGAVDDKYNKAIEEAAHAALEGIPATREQKSDSKTMLITTLLTFTAGGLTAWLPPIGLGILGAAGLVSGAAFARYLFLKHDKTPILYAMGVAPNKRQPNWY